MMWDNVTAKWTKTHQDLFCVNVQLLNPRKTNLLFAHFLDGKTYIAYLKTLTIVI